SEEPGTATDDERQGKQHEGRHDGEPDEGRQGESSAPAPAQVDWSRMSDGSPVGGQPKPLEKPGWWLTGIGIFDGIEGRSLNDRQGESGAREVLYDHPPAPAEQAPRHHDGPPEEMRLSESDGNNGNDDNHLPPQPDAGSPDVIAISNEGANP